MLRYLRIAAALFFALLAIGFVALWVRSYARSDCAALMTSGKHAFSMTSYKSAVWVQRYDADRTKDNGIWTFAVIPTEAIYIYAPGNGLLGLRLFRHEGSEVVALSLPDWFLAACSLAIASALAVKFPRRFTVRGLLIATTLIAATLGLAVYSQR